jgi:hypothetical protein
MSEARSGGARSARAGGASPARKQRRGPTGKKLASTSRQANRGKKKKSAGRRYGPLASKKVGEAIHASKRGKLRAGRSKKKVKSRQQAIAIGLSEARRSGARVPPPSKKKKRRAAR